jgi:HAD superfamily hydrolase (TIGR01509 family)
VRPAASSFVYRLARSPRWGCADARYPQAERVRTPGDATEPTCALWSDGCQPPGAGVPALRAVIFEVDGTLADTERDGHRPAFNAAFAAHGLDISWGVEEYGRVLKITGGQRRIAADLRTRGFADGVDELAAQVHRTKTEVFRDRILGGDVIPRPGLVDLMTSLSSAGIRIAVATTGRRTWVEPLVRKLVGEIVETVVTGDDLTRLKPDPEVYVRVLEQVGLPPHSALAVEDSAVGLRAAVAAELTTVVITTDYTADQDFAEAAGAVRI